MLNLQPDMSECKSFADAGIIVVIWWTEGNEEGTGYWRSAES